MAHARQSGHSGWLDDEAVRGAADTGVDVLPAFAQFTGLDYGFALWSVELLGERIGLGCTAPRCSAARRGTAGRGGG
jgi:hypothetical protein